MILRYRLATLYGKRREFHNHTRKISRFTNKIKPQLVRAREEIVVEGVGMLENIPSGPLFISRSYFPCLLSEDRTVCNCGQVNHVTHNLFTYARYF